MGGLLRPVLTLLGGTATAQVLVFVARPILTRLFPPEAFGVLTVFVTLAAVAVTVAAGQYDSAALLPERDDEAASLLVLGLFGGVVTALLTGLAVVFRNDLAALARDEAVSPALLALPPAVLFLAWGQSFELWHTRRHRFRLIASARLAQGLTIVGGQMAAGLAALGATGLVGPSLAGFGVAALALGLVVLLRDGPALRAVRWDLTRRMAARFSRFPYFSAPAAFLNVLGTRLPVFLLAAFFSTGVVGQFGVAWGTMVLPLVLVTGAVGQVYHVRAAEAHRTGALAPLTRQVLRGMLVVAAYPTLAVLAAGPTLFAFVFGEGWGTSGEYARAMAGWTLFTSVASPLTRIFDVTERQRVDLVSSLGMFATMAVVLLAAGQTGSALGAVIAAGAAGALLRIGHLGWMLHLAGVPLPSAAADTARVLGLALPFALAVFLADALGGTGSVVTGVAVLAGLAYLAVAHRVYGMGAP
ncbi:MAG TPA: lipopolysaccharide biosynthesis protein [Rubricoccaceae bacterium]|nr:lipopolysaccharide biosynthesis protein [Rubricoccaceae bacterium]